MNSVLDLIFLCFGSSELDNHAIHPDLRLILDYAPLIILILIIEKYIQTKKSTIVKNSEEEHIFVKELIKAIRNIDTYDISNIDHLDNIIAEFASSMENIWAKNPKIVNITKHSKSW